MDDSRAIEHLLLRLRPLNRALRLAVERQGRAAARLFRADITPLCVTEEQVQTLLADIDELVNSPVNQASSPFTLTPEESSAEENLRRQSRESRVELPLDRLTEALELSPFEQEAMVLCSAVELDRSYERVFAYILADLIEDFPALSCLPVSQESVAERCERRRALGRYGKLRRTGVLRAFGDSVTEGRQELRLGQDLFSCLTGTMGVQWLSAGSC